jgi:acetyl-CoA carboxylase carboxyltransferase component
MNFMNATCLTTVPQVTVICRKAYGRAYVAMGGGAFATLANSTGFSSRATVFLPTRCALKTARSISTQATGRPSTGLPSNVSPPSP